jgi:hypothetical protein
VKELCVLLVVIIEREGLYDMVVRFDFENDFESCA